MTIKSFVSRTGVKMSADWADENPNMSEMPAGSSHWKCTLRRGRRRMTVYFSQGPAICKEPTVEDVLDCLSSDASSYENARSFEEWASEYGYDTDSRKAEKTFRAVEKQAASLARLFDPEDYETLLYQVERL